MNDQNLLEDQPIAWTPTPEVIERAQLTKFMRQVGVATWDELYAYSINDVEMFTAEVLRFLDIKFDPPYEKLLDTTDGIEFPTWFAAGSEPGAVATGFPARAGLNITEMCLDRWQTDEMKDQPAVIWEDEGPNIHVSFWLRKGPIPNTLTYAELAHEVKGCSAALRALEFGPGDAIGIHLPMVPETIIALLAIAHVGAIAVPVFSGYGASAIAARMNAVGARALFTCDGFRRRGKDIDTFAIAKEVVAKCPTMEKVFVVKKIGSLKAGDASQYFKDQFLDFEGLVDGGGWTKFWDSPPGPTSAEAPLIILYTSGTTGKPKGIAHTHASFPIKAAQDMAFGTDVGKGTRISWYTDIGWMMGPWLIYGALINGATICIYDGAPDYPQPDRMWEFCAKHKVEVLGISPTLIRALSNCGDDLPKKHDLSSLRAFASTGEPWNPAPWWWLFEKVGDSKLPIINYSGGTEISGGILMGNPLLPIKPCSFPAPCPGMDVDILDEEGNSVEAGKVGELVIKQPWIGMARGFWQEKERYLDTYWRRFKDIWVHGDFAMRDKDGHWFILGRSDDTLKVAGKRVGPTEVESLLVAHPQVTEAAVIGVPDEVKGTAMVAFVVLAPVGGVSHLDRDYQTAIRKYLDRLEAELKALVAKDMGKPLAPSKIHLVSALPKTRNAKVMRRVIRSAYLGEDPGDLSALEDPNSVEEIRKAAR